MPSWYKWIRLLLSTIRSRVKYTHTHTQTRCRVNRCCSIIPNTFTTIAVAVTVTALATAATTTTTVQYDVRRIEIIWRTDSINWQIGKCQALYFDSGFHHLWPNWIIFGWFPTTTIGIGIAVDWLTSISMVSSYNIRFGTYTLSAGVSNFLKNLFDFFPFVLAPFVQCSWFWTKYVCVCVCADENSTASAF